MPRLTENNNESTEGVMGFVYGASENEVNLGFAVIELHEAHLVPDVLEAAGESDGRNSGHEDSSVIGIMCKITSTEAKLTLTKTITF